MEKTKIDWCDSSWNPVTGCYHTCPYCYARGIANRFSNFHAENYNGNTCVLDEPFVDRSGKTHPYPYAFMPTFHRYRLEEYKNKKSRNIFICSMADLFGEWVPDDWIVEIFNACQNALQHNYLFLTKNPKRYLDLQEKGILPMCDNMWYGTTAVDSDSFFNVSNSMGKLNEKYKTFISIEPLLGDIWEDRWSEIVWNFYDWVIIGAESGKRKDKVVPQKEWIDKIVNVCQGNKNFIPVFMKSSLNDIMGNGIVKEFPAKLSKNNS